MNVIQQKRIVLGLCIALALLSSCGQKSSEGDASICVSFDQPYGATDADQKANACLAEWALRNAQSGDAAAAVADGLLAACSDAINEATASTPTDNGKAIGAFRRQALFYVTNARAGKCWLSQTLNLP